MKFLKAQFWRQRFGRKLRMTPIFNHEGIMIYCEEPDGSFWVKQILVPAQWTRTDGRGWYLDMPIRLVVRGAELWMYSSKNEYSELADGGELLLYPFKAGEVGDPRQAEDLSIAIRQCWLDANSNVTNAAMPVGVTRKATGRGLTPWARGAVFVGLGIAVFSAGLGAMHLYLHPSGPGMNLTGMSVEEVARLDANPAAIRDVQEQLMAAVGVGQENAKKISGKVEQDHIAALKAMGLDTGISMKNAVSCLAK